MVGTIEARMFNLSLSSTLSSSKVITNLFYEPNSSSLALMHFDSSISLISPFPPFSVTTLLPKTLISPFNSSACFVTFNPNRKIGMGSFPDGKDVKFTKFGTHMNPNFKFEDCPDVKFPKFGTHMNPNCESKDCPDVKGVKLADFGTRMNPNCKVESCSDRKDVVFVIAGPYNGGNKVLLKFYMLDKGGNFGNVQVNCSQNGICFDRKLGGVLVDVSHGMKVMLSGSVNYFAIYSSSMTKLMVFGLKLVGEGNRELRLVKCAVIECCLPVISICVSFGFLILGEMKGIRVFSLRALVKGKVGSKMKARVARGKVDVKLEGRKSKMLNGVSKTHYESQKFGKNEGNVNPSKPLANGYVHDDFGVQSNANAVI